MVDEGHKNEYGSLQYMPYVYLDHAATAPLSKKALGAMLPYLENQYGNPSSFHLVGKHAKDAVSLAREQVARAVGARPDEVIFTSGGTEANSLALLGAARQYAPMGKHIITTTVEHASIIETLEYLENKEGFEITVLPVDRDGKVSTEAITKALRPDTVLVSVILANNEIGTINDIQAVGRVIAAYKKEQASALPLLHTDACQALQYMAIDADALHVDLLTVNAAKVYGPKGTGALFVRRGVKLRPLQFGGSQEFGRRPGTENVAGIVGFAAAVVEAQEMREAESSRVEALREQLIEGIQKSISKIRLNGHRTDRLPNNVNISFMDLEGEALTLYMDAKGIYVSTGSACTSASLDPSHVILALGLPYEVAHGSIRFTLGRQTTKEDIDYVLEVLQPLVEKLRAMSPVRVDPKYYE